MVINRPASPIVNSFGCSPCRRQYPSKTLSTTSGLSSADKDVSLSIGTPADGYYAIRTMLDTGGTAEDASDAEIIDAIKLLAETEGIFAETAGGVTLAVTKKLIEQGRIPRDEEIVICITGNGLKTQDAVAGYLEKPALIKPSLKEFKKLLGEAREPVLV